MAAPPSSSFPQTGSTFVLSSVKLRVSFPLPLLAKRSRSLSTFVGLIPFVSCVAAEAVWKCEREAKHTRHLTRYKAYPLFRLVAATSIVESNAVNRPKRKNARSIERKRREGRFRVTERWKRGGEKGESLVHEGQRRSPFLSPLFFLHRFHYSLDKNTPDATRFGADVS